jgi:hypothetical protein
MDGRAFLQSAQDLLTRSSEANRRSAAGRAYYALLHEGRMALDRWGFPLPPRESIHSFVRLRFVFTADGDLQRIGDALDRLSRLRNQADYQLATPGQFATDTAAVQAADLAQSRIALIDAIDADPARRAAAVAAIRAAWP